MQNIRENYNIIKIIIFLKTEILDYSVLSFTINVHLTDVKITLIELSHKYYVLHRFTNQADHLIYPLKLPPLIPVKNFVSNSRSQNYQTACCRNIISWCISHILTLTSSCTEDNFGTIPD